MSKYKYMNSNLSSFLASPEYSRFQQAYSLENPVPPDRLVINKQYWMVHTIHCWDDICHHDHECRLEYGLEKVIYRGEKKEQIHEFLNEHNTCIPIYIGALQGELTCYFLYPLSLVTTRQPKMEKRR